MRLEILNFEGYNKWILIYRGYTVSKPKVFISYQTKDLSLAIANGLYDKLQQARYTVFFDKEKLEPGFSWSQSLYDNIKVTFGK